MFRLSGALCALAVSLGSASASHATPEPSPTARADLWAQSYSDLPADPAIRFGTLPNGLRYAIMHNATPTGQAALRLRIGAGSLNETDEEQGLAHVLEHMAFKGSIHAPNGEMIKLLEAKGLSFGGDTNARTEETQTVYQLDLPQSDDGSLTLGLDFMRDIAGGLTISPQALEPERGVVLSEERLRDTPDYEVYKARLGFDLKGQLLADRLPIGKVEVIQHAPASLVRAFYAANYQPQNAVLVAVGDFDPADMLARIQRLFGDWRATAPAAAPPVLGTPQARGRAFQLVVRAGVAPSLTVTWATPFDDAPDTAAKERKRLVEILGFNALNRRFSRLSHTPDPPFLAAVGERSDTEESARLAMLEATFRPGRWREAMDALIATQRQALAYGFTQTEVDREVLEYGLALRNAAASASTRRSPAIAEEVVRSVDDREVDTAPDEDLALFTRFTAGLTAGEVDAALRQAFGGAGPLVSLATPDPVAGGEGALATAFSAAETAPVQALAARQGVSWTHTRFGSPGRVADMREVKDLGVTFVRFADGVRLAVKPTAFRKDQVQVEVNFGGGRLDEPRDRDVPDWALSAFVGGGLNDLDLEDIQQALADKTVSFGLSIEDDSYRLSGATRPRDLDTQLQLMAAYMIAPGWRPEAFTRTQAMMALSLQQLPATPQGVQSRDLQGLIHGDDARWTYPSVAEVRATSLDQLKALLDPELHRGPLEIVIVGDTTVAAAVQAVASTFAALPPRAALPVPPSADQVRFPGGGGVPVQRTHEGRPDQALAFVAWPATDLLSDLQRTRRINLASEILQLRLLDKVRVAEGASYSPAAGASESDTYPGYGYLYANVEIPPAKVAGFWRDVDAITADLGGKDVGAEELLRAVQPRIEGIEKAKQTNAYWTAMLHDADHDPRRLDLIRTSPGGYRSITAAEVREAAATYLGAPKAWRFEVLPTNPIAASGPIMAAPVRKTPVEPHTPLANPQPLTPPNPAAAPPSARGARLQTHNHQMTVAARQAAAS